MQTLLSPERSLFEFRWDEENMRLVIGINQLVFKLAIPLMDRRQEWLKGYYKDESLFYPYSGGSWGYDRICKPCGVEYFPGFAYFYFPIPLNKREGPNWKRIHSITKTISSILSILEAISADNDFRDQKLPKTLVVPTALATNNNQFLCGASVSGMVGIGAISFFNAIAESAEGHQRYRFLASSEAMYLVYQRMSKHKSLVKEKFCAQLDQQGLHLTTAGNACGLDPGWGENTSEPYSIEPHNIDSPVQQLSLVVGMASISDTIRHHKPVSS